MAKQFVSRPPARKSGVERYEKIIAAAESLIAENRSLAALTLQSVAAEADVPRVSLYYFFPSIDALIDTLYLRGIDKMVAETPVLPNGSDWRLVMTVVMDNARAFYARNPVEMILSLSPNSLVTTNRANQAYGQELYRLLSQSGAIPSSRALIRVCEVVTELADCVWRKAFIEHGKITAAYHDHAKRAVMSYFESSLEELR